MSDLDSHPPAWLGPVPATRWERHFDGRVVRCFIERPESTYALLADAVAANPHGQAIVCGKTRLSYREFQGIVVAWAARLEDLGVGRGDRVAMLLGNGIAFPAVLFAVLRLGAIAVPISIREQTPGLTYMLAHCGAKVLVHDADLADRLPAASATPQLPTRIGLGPTSLESGIDRLSPGTARQRSPVAVDEEETAVILYTSGTTGRPKGAMLTHLGICHSAMHFQFCMNLSAKDRSVIAVPMSHVTGVIALIAAMVRAAAAMIVMPTFNAGAF